MPLDDVLLSVGVQDNATAGIDSVGSGLSSLVGPCHHCCRRASPASRLHGSAAD